jgi:uncharacterized tellurite resistance protein B-like protein
MLNSIRDFFERHLNADEAPADKRHTIELATAALLVEVIRVDGTASEAERAAVLAAVHEKFGLSGEEADTLVALAEEEMRLANDYFQFTSLINRHFTQEQKQRMLELMWRVAFADNRLSAHEQHLMRRIAELLHVTHGDYIAAKLRAQQNPAAS